MGSAVSGSGSVYQTGGTVTFNTLVAGGSPGAAGSYVNIQYGNFTAGNVVVGQQSDGSFQFSAGAATVTSYLTFGDGAGVNGAGIQNGGVLSVAAMVVGGAGNGSYSQNGGVVRDITEDLILGDQPGSSGVYTLNSSGSIFSINALKVGNSGIGTFTQQKYTTNYPTIVALACQSGSKGYYNMYGGELGADAIVVGGGGADAVFDQEGGSVAVAQSLTIANLTGSKGAYKLGGGLLSAANVYVGDGGTGSFNQTQGSLTVSGSLILGQQSTASGHYVLSGGNVAANTLLVGGTSIFDHSAGTVTIAGDLTLVGNSQYNLSGGSLSAVNENVADFNSSATFLQTGGVNTVSGGLTIRGKDLITSGTYEIDGGTLQAGISMNGGVFNLCGGAVSGNGVWLLPGSYFHWTGGSFSTPSVGIWGGWMTVETDWTYGGSLEVTAGLLDASNHTLSLAVPRGTGEASGSLTTGEIIANNVYIGLTGHADFTQMSGSFYVIHALHLGSALFSSGSYNLLDGKLSVTELDVGNCLSSGTMNWTAGSLTAATVTVGLFGTMTVANDWNYDGTLDVEGGKLDLGSHTLTLDKATTGACGTLGGGQPLAGSTVIGEAGQATFAQSGGAHTLIGTLTLGNQSGASGTYNMTGGSLAADTLKVGVNGSGTLTQNTGSTVTIGGGGLSIAGDNSAYFLLNGSLTVDGPASVPSGAWGTRRMVQRGGVANFHRGLTISSPLATNSATYELSGGTANVTGNLVCRDSGHILFDGRAGEMNVSDALQIVGGNLDVVLTADSQTSYIVADAVSLNSTTANNAMLSLSLGNRYNPGAGPQTWTLVDLTDRSATIAGTFAGLPEGATFTFGSRILTLSYHGGDGNDLVLTTPGVPGANATWTGYSNFPIGGSDTWSSSANWSPNTAIPDWTGAAVTFGNLRSVATVDLESTSRTVGKITFNGDVSTTIEATGAPVKGVLILDNNRDDVAIMVAGTHTISAPISLESDAAITVDGTSSSLKLAGDIQEVGSCGITKLGDGVLVLAGSDSYSGGTIVDDGTLYVTSSNALPDGTSLTVGAGGTLIFNPSQAAAPVVGSPSAVAVPEPGTLLLLSVAACCAAAYQRVRSRQKN